MSDFFIEPHDDRREYITFTSDIDLTSADQSPMGPVRGHARSLRVEDAGSGTLAVVYAGSQGTTRTFTGVAAGFELAADKIVTIKSTTDVGKVTVGW